MRKKAEPGEAYFTIEEVAELLKVNKRTVRRWISSGRLTAYRFGSLLRVADRDLRAFLAVHRAV
jgi:excisionase family DNA binding protein